jgi:hypothetical protein
VSLRVCWQSSGRLRRRTWRKIQQWIVNSHTCLHQAPYAHVPVVNGNTYIRAEDRRVIFVGDDNRPETLPTRLQSRIAEQAQLNLDADQRLSAAQSGGVSGATRCLAGQRNEAVTRGGLVGRACAVARACASACPDTSAQRVARRRRSTVHAVAGMA